jgi:hypothetical protein
MLGYKAYQNGHDASNLVSKSCLFVFWALLTWDHTAYHNCTVLKGEFPGGPKSIESVCILCRSNLSTRIDDHNNNS